MSGDSSRVQRGSLQETKTRTGTPGGAGDRHELIARYLGSVMYSSARAEDEERTGQPAARSAHEPDQVESGAAVHTRE